MATTPNNLVVQLQLDLAPYKTGLQAMVTSARAAADQTRAQMVAGMAGVQLPTIDTSSIEQVIEDAQANAARLRAEFAQPLQIPAPTPPPPVQIPQPDPPAPTKIPAPDTSSFAAVRTQVQTMLKQPFDQAGLTLDQVRKAKAELDRQLQSAATTKVRGEILGLTSQLEALETKMQQTATATATLHPASKQAASGMSTATMTANALGFATNDLAVASVDLRMGIMGVSNNLPQIISGFAGMKAEAAATGVAVRTQMLAALAGPGGLILGVTALTTALPFLISWLGREKDAHEDTAKGVRTHRDEVNGLIRDLQRLSGARAYSAVSQARDQLDQVGFQIQSLDAAVARRQRNMDEIVERVRRRRGLSDDVSAAQIQSAFFSSADAQEYIRLQREVESIRANGIKLNGEEISSREVLLQTQRDLNAQIAATERRERDNLGFRLGALQDEQDTLAEIGRQTSTQAQRQAEVNAQIRETQRLMDQRMESGEFDPDRQARAQAALDRAGASARRKETRQAEAAMREARRIAGLTIETDAIVVEARREGEDNSRLHQIAMAEERLAIVTGLVRDQVEAERDGYAKRSALARLEAEQAALASVLALQRADAERERAEAAARASFDTEAAQIRATVTVQAEVDARIRGARAERNAALQKAAQQHQLALLQIERAGVEARTSLRAAFRQAEASKDEAVMDSLVAQARAIAGDADEAGERMLAEAERRQARLQAMAQQTRQALSRTLGDFIGGAFAEAQYSDEERDLMRDQLDREEAEIRESLRRREGDREAHELRLRDLRLERSEFEAEVARDERSRLAKGTEAAYESLRGMLADWLQDYAAGKLTELFFHTSTEEGKTFVTASGTAARLALGAQEIAGDLAKAGASMVEASAKWIADAVGKLGIFSLAAIPAGVAGLYGAYEGAKALFGFRVGGHTGTGRDDDIAGVVHRNEVVLESGIVRGQLPDVMALRGLLQSGVSAADLVALASLPGGAPSEVASLRADATRPSADLGPILAELREVRLELGRRDAQLATVARAAETASGAARDARHISGRTARALLEAAAQEERSRGGGRRSS